MQVAARTSCKQGQGADASLHALIIYHIHIYIHIIILTLWAIYYHLGYYYYYRGAIALAGTIDDDPRPKSLIYELEDS